MKILLLAPSTKPIDGWGTFARNMEIGLQEQGHKVTVLTAEQGLPMPLVLLRSPFAFYRAWKAIRCSVAAYKPDVIHVLAEPYVLVLPWATNIPYVMNFHATYGVSLSKYLQTKWLMKKALQKCAGFFVCSKYTEQKVIAAIGKSYGSTLQQQVASRSHPIRLAVQIPKYIPKKAGTNQHHVLFVGQVKSRKGVLEIVRGFLTYVEQSKDTATLDIVGSCNDKSTYADEIRAILPSNATLHGRVNDESLAQLYQKADVFIMLSKQVGDSFEGYGLVFIEANARGIPTISSRESGGSEAVCNGETGYVVDHNDPKQIADALRNILIEKKISPQACRSWAEKHNLQQQATTCVNLYKSII